MKQIHPIDMDTMPKRRKAKGNPYKIFTVGINTDHPQFFVCFRDCSGVEQCLEIEKKVYQALDGFELEDLSELNEMDNHYEHSVLTEGTLNRRAVKHQPDMEELIFTQLENEQLHRAISKLPEVQRRRVMLYYFEKYTYEQIGVIEGCSHPAIIKSMRLALKNLKKFLEE